METFSYWPRVRGIHRPPVNSPHKGQWRGALMFSLIGVWNNTWVNNGVAGYLRRHRTYYDVKVMTVISFPHHKEVFIFNLLKSSVRRTRRFHDIKIDMKHMYIIPGSPYQPEVTILTISKMTLFSLWVNVNNLCHLTRRGEDKKLSLCKRHFQIYVSIADVILIMKKYILITIIHVCYQLSYSAFQLRLFLFSLTNSVSVT